MSKVHKTSTYQKQILINELLASAKSKLSSRIILQNKLIIIVCLFFWPLATVLATDLVDLLGKWWQVTPTALNTSTSISANINDLANQDFQHKLCVLSFNLLPPWPCLHGSLSWSLGSIFCRNSITFAGSGGPVMSMKCCMATTHGAPSTSAPGRQRLNVAEFRSRDLSKTSRPKCTPNSSPLLVQGWYFVTRSVRWKVEAREKHRFFWTWRRPTGRVIRQITAMTNLHISEHTNNRFI